MDTYDIVFIGHMAIDEVHHHNGTVTINPGSAVLCGALAAANVGREVAVVTRMAPEDESILSALYEAKVEVHIIPAAETTYIQVVHPSDNMDDRELKQLKNAGIFNIYDFPVISSNIFHLAGISDQEFSLDFVKDLKSRKICLSADMQSFVRQVDSLTGQIWFRDVEKKKDLFMLLDYVKLDIVEAEILVKTNDLELAARKIADWGCREILITSSEGVLGLVNGEVYFSRFTHRSVIGRTGRGDTTFGAYLAWRIDHSFKEALDFAAALVSIKMEKIGPFAGDLKAVLSRMNM